MARVQLSRRDTALKLHREATRTGRGRSQWRQGYRLAAGAMTRRQLSASTALPAPAAASRPVWAAASTRAAGGPKSLHRFNQLDQHVGRGDGEGYQRRAKDRHTEVQLITGAGFPIERRTEQLPAVATCDCNRRANPTTRLRSSRPAAPGSRSAATRAYHCILSHRGLLHAPVRPRLHASNGSTRTQTQQLG